MTTAKLDATTQRWVAALASYTFKIFYWSGKQNVEADALSRIEWDKDDMAAELEQGCCLESSLPLVPPQPVTAKSTQLDLRPQLMSQEWKKEQRSDPDISKIIQLLESNKLVSYRMEGTDTHNVRIYLKYRKDLVLKNGLLYHTTKLKNHDTVVFQFVLPDTHCYKTLVALHDDMGHMGMD